MQPLLIFRPAGRKPGYKYSALSLFLSSHLCFYFIFANPARCQKPGASWAWSRVEGHLPSQRCFWVRNKPEKCGCTLLLTAVYCKSICISKKEENLVELVYSLCGK